LDHKIENKISKQIIDHNSDVIIRSFQFGFTQIEVAIVYIDGLTDKMIIQDKILKSIMYDLIAINPEQNLSDDFDLKSWIKEGSGA
jgi:hypothetical protein